MDGQQKSVSSRHMLATGGAQPSPALRTGDHVLVRVRTKQGGAHPSSNGVCDYYIPAEVQLLPMDSRKGHALHSVIAFNGQTVTSARKGIVKISQAQYSAICKYIRTKLASSSHPEGTRTPSPTASHTTSTLESLSLQSSHTSRSASPLWTILEQQRVQGEQLERQLSVLTSLQEQLAVVEKRREVKATEVQTKDEEDEEVLNTNEGTEDGEDEEVLNTNEGTEDEEDEEVLNTDEGTEDEENKEEVLNREATETEGEVLDVQPPPATVSDDIPCCTTRGEWIADYLPHHPPATCDQGMNTGPWMEDRSMNTEPATESRCVGTEWSDLSSNSSSVSDHEDGPSDYVDGPPLHTLPTELTPVPPPSLPADSLLGQQVLARWPDDGWYYRG